MTVRNLLHRILVATLLVATGCDALFGDRQSSALGSGDGGTCLKNEATLAGLLTREQRCDTLACPSGSYCNADFLCDWECFKDSDCGILGRCSCDGRCIGSSPTALSDAGSGDQSCERVRSKLLDLRTSPRLCTYEEECPHGARCDSLSRACVWDCLGTADPEFPCTAGTECSCQGLCVLPSAAPATPAPASELPRLEVDPGRITLLPPVAPATDWTPRRIDFRLTTLNRKLFESGVVKPKVVVKASAGLGVVCSEIGRDTVNYPSSCELLPEGWTPEAWGTGLMASRYLWVRPHAGTTQTQFELTIASNGIANAHLTVNLDVFTPTAAAPVPTTPQDGVYSGSILLKGVGTAVASLGPQQIPVTVWKKGTTFLFHDDLRQVSPTGKLRLQGDVGVASSTFPTPYFVWLTGAEAQHSSGYMLASATMSDLAFVGQSESLSGKIAVKVDTSSLSWTFQLRRTESLPTKTCTNSGQCERGETCDSVLQLCTPGDAWESAPYIEGNPTNFLVQEQAAPWRYTTQVHDLFSSNQVSGTALSLPGVFFPLPGDPALVGTAESALCYDADDLQETALTLSEVAAPRLNIYGLDARVLDVSGDMRCLDGRVPSAIGLLAYADNGRPGNLGPGDMLRSCLEELGREPTIDDKTAALADRAEAIFRDDKCISLSRFFAALGVLPGRFEAYQPRQIHGVTAEGIGWWSPPPQVTTRWSEREQRLYQRLIGQWIDLHSFLAQSGQEESGLVQALASTGSAAIAGDAIGAGLTETILSQMESGWNLLLERETALALLWMSPSLLRAPDYRQRGPVAYWSFDPGDLIGNPLTLANDLIRKHTLSVFSAAPVSESFASRGGLLWPSKTQAYGLRRASQSLRLDGELAVSYWIRVDGIAAADESDAYILAVNAYAPTASPAIDQSSIEVGTFLDASGKVGFFAQHKGKSDTLPERTTWPYRRALGGNPVHVVIVRAREDLTTRRTSYVLYVDGVRQTDGVESGTYADFGETSSTDIYIGRHNGTKTGAYWQGLLDDVAIWERPLGQAEVTKLYGFGRAGSTDDPALLVPIAVPLKAHHEQPIGLPVKMLETMSSHLRLLRGHVQGASLASYAESVDGWESDTRQQALDRLGTTLRYASLVDSWATSLHATASRAGCREAADCSPYPGSLCGTQFQCTDSAGAPIGVDIPWEPRWQRAREEFASLRSQVVDQALALQHLQNPLGIREDDLPLFFGDLQGTNSRFFASSDYLLNTWALPAVATAQAALDGARTAWLNQRTSRIEEQMSRDDADRRLEQLAAQYGGRLVNICGLKMDSAAALRGFVSGDLTAQTCYVDEKKPECTISFDIPTADKVPWDVAKYTFCVLDKISTEHAVTFDLDIAAGSISKSVHELVTKTLRSFRGLRSRIYYNTATVVGQSASVVAENDLDQAVTVDIPLVIVLYLRRLLDTISSPSYSSIVIDSYSGKSPQEVVSEAMAFCRTELKGDFPAPDVRVLEPEHFEVNACLRGQLGSAHLELVGAYKDVSMALLNWRTGQDRFDLKVRECLGIGDLGNQAVELGDAHRDRALAMYDELQHAEEQARWMEAGVTLVAEGAIAATTAGGGVVGKGIPSFIAGFFDESADIKRRMQDEQLRFENKLRALQSAERMQSCVFEAEAMRLEVDPHRETVKRRAIDAGIAFVAMRTLGVQIEQTIVEGTAAIDRERGRTVRSIAHHYWLDEKIERYRQEFEWARRLTYLAMRAVEFEFQQSMPLRLRILTARNSNELDDALRDLQREQAGRTINRRRPEESSLVLSLRDDILKLQDRTGAPFGERRWSTRKRFRERLWSPANIIRDEHGKYLGQGIRFAVSPEGALALRCAERMWRVSATIQGDLLDVQQPEVPMLLLKSNSFSSQWCEGQGPPGADRQAASIRPTSQLFRGTEQGGSESQRKNYSSAFLTPWFNVRRGEFYKDLYREGASEELAGRGLYGEYVLLFPYSGLLEPKVGFPLDNVDDVLLRFDYLSVDDLPNLQ